MSDVVISVEGVGKQYPLGANAGYKTLRESLSDVLHFRRRPPPSLMWAVQDVSFTIKQGEVVGIIGRNGAGKSTLLKILSRITTPTCGSLAVTGRLASLLEVGTGFHPELTGRENIFLNGGILGMTRAEIRKRFDEIVAFAEVEKFVDTPVKHYSSGMYLRLAFAVAAHLEPEILIVDEVLAVGDAAFQKKCLAKMEDVGKGGRTVIFVSHSMSAITRLCPRTILLDQGTIVKDGPSASVVGAYLRSGLGTTAHRHFEPARAPRSEWAILKSVRVLDKEGATCEVAEITSPVGLCVQYEVTQGGTVLVPNFHVFNENGTCVFVVQETAPEWRNKPREQGEYNSTVWIPGNFLAEGTLIVGAALSSMVPVVYVHFFEPDAVAFQVVDSGGDNARGGYGQAWPGVVRPVLQWTTQFIGAKTIEVQSSHYPSGAS